MGYRVCKVYHFMNRSGQHGHYRSDLIFIDGVPHIVIYCIGDEQEKMVPLTLLPCTGLLGA